LYKGLKLIVKIYAYQYYSKRYFSYTLKTILIPLQINLCIGKREGFGCDKVNKLVKGMCDFINKSIKWYKLDKNHNSSFKNYSFIYYFLLINSGYNNSYEGGFIIKKVITIILILSIMTTASSLVFARGRSYQPKHNVRGEKNNATSLIKGIQSIAPGSTTSSAIDLQIEAQADVIKTAYDAYNTTMKQIIVKRMNTSKLIMQIRRSRQTLSNDQYTNLNTLITTINSEANLIVNINGINNVIRIANTKNASKIGQVTLQDLTTMLNNINTNITHLNTISMTFDTVNSTLAGVANTTPAAITTQPAISN
jgi:hypothetical protein